MGKGQALDTDQETVRRLEANLRDRESKDTNSMEWITRDPLPRRSPHLKEREMAEEYKEKDYGEALGGERNEAGQRWLL